MPFNIAQILGGWRRKDNVRRKTDKFSAKQTERRKTPIASEAIGGALGTAEEKKISTIINKGGLAWKFIKSPHISEKATMLGDGKYVFRIDNFTNKSLLKNVIEKRYGVKVESINILAARDKKRRHGQTIGTKQGFKKAIVILKNGQMINQF